MKPIIMSTDSVKAILDGRKTMTRRVIKPLPITNKSETGWIWITKNNTLIEWNMNGKVNSSMKNHCPYGSIGDKLWVRETWCKGYEAFVYRPPNYYYKVADAHGDIYIRENEINDRGKKIKWKSPRFMPKDASRITLQITDIKVERLQYAKTESIIAEGIRREENDGMTLIDKWKKAWNNINAKRGYSYESNPWVWVISFKAVKHE